VLLQGFIPCNNSVHLNNINNSSGKDPQVKASYVQSATRHFYDETFSDIRNGIHDGAQSFKSNTPGNGNMNSNLVECGEFYSKISLKREYNIAADVDYISCNGRVSENERLIRCVKSRDYHLYNQISTQKIYDHRTHSFERSSGKICGSLRNNFINNNTTTPVTSNKGDISSGISGIKRNCGRILPIPSSSTRPLSIKLPFHTSRTNENRKNSPLKDVKVTHSQARPLSIVLPSARYNINHSLKSILPMDKSSHSSRFIPSPKIHPSVNPYQRLRYSTDENVRLIRNQTDELNNNSNLTSFVNDEFISMSVASSSTPNSDCDRENNNISANKNASLLNKFKPGPMSITRKPVRLQSSFNSSNLVNGQKCAYPNTVLCTGQDSMQINPNYPNCTNATMLDHNVSTTIMPSTHSSATTSPSSSSVVNSLPEQPSVLLVVYPVPFVHESNELLMEKQQCNPGNNEEKLSSTCHQQPKESARCGIQ
jgi:hypothetical protein